MGSLYRSELMSLCQLFLQTDAAFDSIAEIGELSLCQFRDLHPDLTSYQRKFVQEIRRCEDMERKLRFFREEIERTEIKIPDVFNRLPPPGLRDLKELETAFDKLDEEMAQINESTKALKANYEKLREIKLVLAKVRLLLDEGTRAAAYQSISEQQTFNPEIGQNGLKSEDYIKTESELKFVAGVIRRDRIAAFERILWRICRGKVYMRTHDYLNDNMFAFAEDENEKSIFMVFMSGDQLLGKVGKVCEAFRANVIDVPDTEAQRAELAVGVSTQLEDMSTVVNRTLEHRDRVLRSTAVKQKAWELRALKLKSVFHVLNMFDMDVTQKCLIGECWIPSSDLGNVQQALRIATQKAGSTVPAILHKLDTADMPPTFNRTNKFTVAFQNIVDSYGIADYREINPGPWTIITFPFIFAVMFGDTGHGIIMFLSALMLVLFEKKIQRAKIRDEIFTTFFGGRYVILLMGLFSIYTGLIYNDIYSKSVNIFGSQWVNPYNTKNLANWLRVQDNSDAKSDYLLTFDPNPAFKDHEGPYPFGVDPIWNVAQNKLNFLNPMKMKSSVIVGICQMMFGLVLSLCNYMHRGSLLDVFFVFVPQLLFLSLIFVYLCVMIVVKWVFFYVRPKDLFGWYYPGPNCAPSLLIGFISMFMLKSRKEGYTESVCNSTMSTNTMVTTTAAVVTTTLTTISSSLASSTSTLSSVATSIANATVAAINTTTMASTLPASTIPPIAGCFAVELDQCSQQLWYPHQDKIEMVFLFVGVISIPVMLLVKPLVQRSRHNRGMHVEVHGDSHEFNFGDVMVYQAIHTIEFALGCISHTASYLRLWALSLAHAQLSEVLWTMVMRMAFKMKGTTGAVAIFIIFALFAILSICILILMEGLSAFLHALRLHWVEFQSKFYSGNGIAFEPFSFNKLIRQFEGLDD